jgi:3-hydroxyacyl-[acyl-carrier-protein] dehydratase
METTLPLPHAYPFLLLDRIVNLRPGVSAVGLKNLTRGDPLLDADGRLPPVLLAEALAQAAGVAVLGVRRDARAALARIDRYRSRGRVGAGDQLRVSVRVLKVFAGAAKVRGTVRVNGRVRAAGEVVLQIGESFPQRGEGGLS